MLTAQWTRRLPLLQKTAPAELAARLIHAFLDDFPDIDSEQYFVIDFCSGAGGPTPLIEKSVNTSRSRAGHQPIPFRLSDFHPNLDAWMPLASHSANLSFIPQPVDATDTTHAPPLVVSKTSSASKPSGDHKSIHLYSLSFHHFNDEDAGKIMKSTLATADGVCILELQDRSLGMLMLMLGEPGLLFLVTMLWFPFRPLHLFFTYVFPVLPFVQAWDGVVSCLRTRSFEETLRLAERALGERARVVSEKNTGVVGEKVIVAECGEWKFVGVRRLHTWPFGYMNAFLARKKV
ncbi:hypothetical protein E4T44_04211 [Aureobasidium sp. EXF-8845]|nr:hypothetical protein E4T44_04211 [Aureobasidium sp. EXF-8845]KAI4853878.1 hypothetical protein E4T45_04146 [Aureobasidium sp. EXF-8846]